MRYICTEAYDDYLFQSSLNLAGHKDKELKWFYHSLSMYVHAKMNYYMARDTKQLELIQECLKLMKQWKNIAIKWTQLLDKKIRNKNA